MSSEHQPGKADAAAYDASEASKDKGEPSLTSTLTILQRTQLLQLIARATAVQRQAISDAFRADATLPPELRSGLSPREGSRDNFDLNPSVDPGKADVGAFDEARKKLKEREAELRKLDVVRLRSAVLSWFDEWRGEMLQRVGEVVKLKKEAKRQLEEYQGDKASTNVRFSDEKKLKVDSKTTTDDGETDRQLKALYPPIETPLAALEEEKRILIIHSMLLLLLSLKHYSSPSRVLLLHLSTSLHVSSKVVDEDEVRTATGLIEGAKELSGKEEADKAAADNKTSHKWKVGLATVAGAAVIGITGGLAAPLVAAGVGSVMGGLGLGATAAAGYLGSLAGSTVLVGGLFGAYGGRMTGQMMDNYAKEVSDFAFLPVHDLHTAQRQAKSEKDGRPKLSRQESEQFDEAAGKTDPQSRRLRITVGISGWLTNEEEAVAPWKVLGEKTEAFALRFDLEALMNLGHAMQAMVSSAAWGYAKKTVISQTLLAELAGAVAWPMGIAKISRVVDNPFTVAKNRADKAGQVLADALMNRAQGERPVSLIGYSLGARTIYSCLQTLAQKKAFGLVESAVLIGAPTPSASLQWRSLRTVVSGRLVNIYSENDYVLSYLYRTSSLQLGVAGLQHIEGVYGIENINISETVSGHLRYRYLVGSILRRIGWDDLSESGLQREREALEKMEAEARAKTMKQKGKEAGLMVAGFEQTGEKTADPDGDKGGESEEDAEKRAQNMEKEVREQTQMSLLQRGAQYLSLSMGEKGEGNSGEEERKGKQQVATARDGAQQSGKAPTAEGKKEGGGYASYLPNMSNMPSMPKMSNMPNMPAMPNMPNMPNMPKMSGMPNMPKLSAPSMPKWGAKDEKAGDKSKSS